MDVTILETKKLKDLLHRAVLYDYLSGYGVDNWEWYCDSIQYGLERDAEDLEISVKDVIIEDIVDAIVERDYPCFNMEEALEELGVQL